MPAPTVAKRIVLASANFPDSIAASSAAMGLAVCAPRNSSATCATHPRARSRRVARPSANPSGDWLRIARSTDRAATSCRARKRRVDSSAHSIARHSYSSPCATVSTFVPGLDRGRCQALSCQLMALSKCPAASANVSNAKSTKPSPPRVGRTSTAPPTAGNGNDSESSGAESLATTRPVWIVPERTKPSSSSRAVSTPQPPFATSNENVPCAPSRGG